MDLILYKYLLRRLVSYPITFSRNKNFDAYESQEGKQAVKRAKVIRKIISELENVNLNVTVEKLEEGFLIKVRDDKMHITSEYLINDFEKELIKERISGKYYFD